MDEAKIQEENRLYEETYRAKDLCNNANILRLDIATAIFQSIRVLQNKDISKNYLYLLPVCQNYSEAVSSLSDKYSLQELSSVYQLYGIIGKINRDIYNWTSGNEEAYEKVKLGFLSILIKIYGENYNDILRVDPNKICYEDLYKNEFISPVFKDLLLKLDDLCLVENLMKEKHS